MRKLWTRFALLLAALLSVGAWIVGAGSNWYEDKPFEEWSEKEVQQMLAKSPWVETHVYMAASGGAVVTGAAQNSSRGMGRDVAVDPETRHYLRFQWFSARPVRMALARMALAQNSEIDREGLNQFATETMPDAVIALVLDSSPPGSGLLRSIQRSLQEWTLEEASEETFLQVGKTKVPLKDYRPPQGDGTGAKFIFPRTLEGGKPLLDPAQKDVRFQTHVRIPRRGGGQESLRVRLKYKLKDMQFKGQLEY